MANLSVFGKNISYLRNSLGITQEELSNYLGMNRVELSYYENGQRQMPLENIEKISLLFGVEISTLYDDELQNKQMPEFAFRSISAGLAIQDTENKNSLQAEDLKNIADFRSVIREHIKDNQPVNNLQIEKNSIYLENETKKQAMFFRQEQGLGLTASLKMRSMLMQLGVITVFKPFTEKSKFSGMAQKEVKENRIFRFMLINSNHSVGRQNFTICHELYHLFIQKDFSFMFCSTGQFPKNNEVELKADLFASHLLMPESGIIRFIPAEEMERDKISLKTILFIENYFGCSRTALLRTLKQMNLIGNYLFDKFSKNIIEEAIAYGYEKDLYVANNLNLTIGDKK